MEHIEEEVLPIDIVDVAIVRVGPIRGPRVDDFEPKASGLEAGPILNNHRTADDESVLPAEAGTEFVVWDVAFASRTSLPSLRCVLIVFFMRALGAFLFWKLFLLWLFRLGRLWLFLLRRFFRFRLGLRFLFFQRFSLVRDYRSHSDPAWSTVYFL
jgi:hypothetical protein